jgi:hypothetical protein
MTEEEWLACADPDVILKFLRGKAKDRKLRLFAVACWRRVWSLLETEEQRQAVEVAERYADELASFPELAAVRWLALGVAAGSGSTAAASAVFAVRLKTRVAAAIATTDPDESSLELSGDNMASFQPPFWPWAATQTEAANVAWREQSLAQTIMLRDIFGPLLFRTLIVHPDVLAWNDRLVVRLAQTIYEERQWGNIGILHDALLDAGCDNEEMLSHAREQGSVHHRGCWLIDLLLNKE